jgi:excisionase family DNA binding protein
MLGFAPCMAQNFLTNTAFDCDFYGLETSRFIEVEVLRELLKRKLIREEAIVALAEIIKLQKEVEVVIASASHEADVANGTTPTNARCSDGACAKNDSRSPLSDGDRPAQVAPAILDKQSLAARYEIGVRTVEAWMHKGYLPYTKIGGVVRFHLDQVDAALKKKFGRNQRYFSELECRTPLPTDESRS